MVDHVIIGVEILRIYSECSLEKEFIQLIDKYYIACKLNHMLISSHYKIKDQSNSLFELN